MIFSVFYTLTSLLFPIYLNGLMFPFIFGTNFYSVTFQEFLSLADTTFNMVMAFAIVAAFIQVKMAKDTIRADSQLKVRKEWRNKNLYTTTIYFHELRRAWKEKDLNPKNWKVFAAEWINLYKDDDIWQKRRELSQFFESVYIYVKSGSMSYDDLFEIIPETGRLLSVLIPIEIEIHKNFLHKEKNKIAEWDIPQYKWGLHELYTEYEKWFKNKSKSCLADYESNYYDKILH